MSDPTYTTTQLDALDPSTSLVIGDRVRVLAERSHILSTILGPDPNDDALELAKEVQNQLYARNVATMRAVVQGTLDDSDVYHLVVELEVVDVVDPATGRSALDPANAPLLYDRLDRTQGFLTVAAIKPGVITTSPVAFVAAALLAAIAIITVDKYGTYLLHKIDPVDAPPYGLPEVDNVKQIAFAAAVISIFYFLSKVAR